MRLRTDFGDRAAIVVQVKRLGRSKHYLVSALIHLNCVPDMCEVDRLVTNNTSVGLFGITRIFVYSLHGCHCFSQSFSFVSFFLLPSLE